jgi:Bacteriophage related domain of unknown function
MATLEQVRTEVAGIIVAIQTDWTAYPLIVETDNRTLVNQATQTNPYLQVAIRNISAEQINLAYKPLVEHIGQIVISAVVKDGTGQAEANALLDFVTPYFDLKTLTYIRCHAFEPYPAKLASGWWYCPAIVNFWHHRQSV